MPAFDKVKRFEDEGVEIVKKEHLNKNAKGVQVFNKTFRAEYALFAEYSRHLANKRAKLANTAVDWLGVGGIGSSVAMINTTIAVLAAAGVIGGFIPIALGFSVAIIGIATNIGFTRYRNSVKRKQYKEAVEFIEVKKMDKNIEYVRSHIAHQFSDYLNHCSSMDAHKFAKKTQQVMANAIIHKKAKNVRELISPDMMKQYQAKIPRKKSKSTFSLLGFFKKLKKNIVNLWRHRKQREKADVKASRVGMFSRSAANDRIHMRHAHQRKHRAHSRAHNTKVHRNDQTHQPHQFRI